MHYEHHLKGDPLGQPRNPLAIYLLLLGAVTGVGGVLGYTTSAVVKNGVRPEAAFAWSLILALGSILTLVGMFWQGDQRTGLVMKRTGMFSVGIAAMVYGVVVTTSLGTSGMFAGGVTIGFGIACFAQFAVINHRINVIIQSTRDELPNPP